MFDINQSNNQQLGIENRTMLVARKYIIKTNAHSFAHMELIKL